MKKIVSVFIAFALFGGSAGLFAQSPVQQRVRGIELPGSSSQFSYRSDLAGSGPDLFAGVTAPAASEVELRNAEGGIFFLLLGIGGGILGKILLGGAAGAAALGIGYVLSTFDLLGAVTGELGGTVD